MSDNNVGFTISGKDSSGPAFDSVDKRIKGLGETAKGILNADFLRDAAEGAKSFVSSTIQAASDLGESANAVNKIFGESSKQIIDWGETNAAQFGLSKRAFNEAIVPLGANLKNAGLSMDQVSSQTLNLTKRAADMASVFNTSVGDALEAIQAGLRGEADPLERYGVGLSAAAVEQQALADTGKKSAAELSNQEKTLARVEIIMKQTAATAGDFADTTDGLANSARVAGAQIEDAKAKIGEGFLPIIAKAAQLAGDAASAFGQLPAPLQKIAGGAALLTAGFVYLAPKVMAAKSAFDEMRNSAGEADGKVRSAAKGAAILAAGLIAVNVASSAFGKSAAKGANEATAALLEYARTGQASSEVTKHLDYDLGTLGSGGFAKAGNAVAGFTESLTDLGGVFDESLQHAGERIGSIDAALSQLVQSGHGDEARAIFDKLNEAARKQGISTQDLIAGLPQYSEALAGVNSQQSQVANSSDAVATGFDALGDSLAKVKTPLDAVSKVFGILIDKDRGVLDFAEAQDKLSDSLKKNGDAFKINTEKGRDNRDAILDAVSANEKLYEANINSGVSAQDAAAQYDQNTAALERQLQKAGYTKQEIDDLIGKYRGIPGKVDTEIATHGLTQALTDLADLIRTIYNIPTTRDIYVKTHFIGGQGQSRGGEYRTGGIKGAATGGPQDGLTMVGEEGPEFVRLPTGSMVYPRANTMQMLAQGAGGAQRVAVEVHFTGSGSLWSAFMEAQRAGEIQILRTAIA